MAETQDKDDVLFMHLVLTFQMAAWQQLGKIKNPITDKIERNLEQARYSIDMLEAIRKKTAGNINDAEKRMLDQAISELQLNYIDEAGKDKKPADQPKVEPPSNGTGDKITDSKPVSGSAEPAKT
ncbi:MAG TPA: DUF1844 domain-containing protein [bacterium]